MRPNHRRVIRPRGVSIEHRLFMNHPLRVVTKQHDRRSMKRVHQLRGHDADHAAVPAVARHHEHGSRADFRIRLHDLPGVGDDLGFFLLAADILAIELLRERARLVGHRLVAREEQPRRDIGRAHPAGGVDARSYHEPDMVAVDLASGEAADVEQGPKAYLVRPPR